MATTKKKRMNDPSYRKSKPEYYPVQRHIPIASSGPVVGSYSGIDVAKFLSTINHRLYRQGKTYQVKLDIDNEVPSPGTYEVYALMDTWYVLKAWSLGRQVYMDATHDEREHMSSAKTARWEDFRVGFGIPGLAANTGPFRYDTTLFGAYNADGEFESSRLTKPDGTTQLTFSWGATGSGEYGLMVEYDKTANTDAQASSVPAANAYAGALDGNSELQSDDLAAKGNLPPYNQTSFLRYWVKVGELHNAGTGSQRLSTGYFNAPCGLVVVKTPVPNLTLSGELSLTVKNGGYKGVSAFNMG